MERELFRQDFEGDKIPDAAVAIPTYLSHQSTGDLYKEFVTLVVDKTVVSPNKMVSLSTELVKRLHCKNGHRIQIFGLFLREQYYKAISDGAAMFPYQSVDNSTLDLKNPAVQARVYSVEEMGGQFYSRDSPHHADPLDSSDEHMTEEQIKSASKEKLDKWNLLKGIAARVTKHKTDAKYPCWLWFSAFDQAYLKCYEAIVFRFCQSKNITRTGKSPFFINSLGEALVQPHSKPLDFSDFALLAGIPSAPATRCARCLADICTHRDLHCYVKLRSTPCAMLAPPPRAPTWGTVSRLPWQCLAPVGTRPTSQCPRTSLLAAQETVMLMLSSKRGRGLASFKLWQTMWRRGWRQLPGMMKQ